MLPNSLRNSWSKFIRLVFTPLPPRSLLFPMGKNFTWILFIQVKHTCWSRRRTETHYWNGLGKPWTWYFSTLACQNSHTDTLVLQASLLLILSLSIISIPTCQHLAWHRQPVSPQTHVILWRSLLVLLSSRFTLIGMSAYKWRPEK